MFPYDCNTAPNNPSDAAITPRPTPTNPILTPEISAEATPNIVKPPAIAVNPLAISSHCNPPNDLTASANIINAFPIIFNAIPRPIIVTPPALIAPNKAISANIPAIPANPIIIESGSMFPNPSTASFNTNNAADKIKIPVADVIPSPPNLAPTMNSANSPNNTPIANNPAPNTSASIDPIFSNALAIT